MHICVADRRHRAASVFACICVCVCGRAHVTPAATRPSVNTWNTGCTRVCVHALRLSAARGWARIFRRGYFPRDKSVFVSFRIFDISRIFPSFFLSLFLGRVVFYLDSIWTAFALPAGEKRFLKLNNREGNAFSSIDYRSSKRKIWIDSRV